MFQAFACANNIGSLINSLFGAKNFDPFPSFTSSPSSGGISGISINSSESLPSSDDTSVKSLSSDFFCLLDFTLSAIVFLGVIYFFF